MTRVQIQGLIDVTQEMIQEQEDDMYGYWKYMNMEISKEDTWNFWNTFYTTARNNMIELEVQLEKFQVLLKE